MFPEYLLTGLVRFGCLFGDLHAVTIPFQVMKCEKIDRVRSRHQ